MKLFTDTASSRRKMVYRLLLEICLPEVRNSLLFVLVFIYNHPGFA